MYLTQGLHRALQRHPEKIALVHGNTRISFGQLHERVSQLAGVFKSLGIQPGDRVALLAWNSSFYLEALFATWWLGAIATPLNCRWSRPELHHALIDSKPKILLADYEFLDSIALMDFPTDHIQTVLTTPGSKPHSVYHSLERHQVNSHAIDDIRADPMSVSTLLYTGGTTGTPKAAMLSHLNLWAPLVTRIAELPAAENSVALLVAPLFHAAGLTRMLYQIIIGEGQVILAAFEATQVIRAITEDNVNDLVLIPSMIEMLLSHPDFKNCKKDSVRRITHGTSPISDELLDRVLNEFPNVAFSTTYGMTESGGVATVSKPENYSVEARKSGRVKTVGRAGWGTELKIVDSQGVEVTAGNVGEVLIRSPGVMLGYWNQPAESSSTVRDGWLYTGDGGYLDNEGYLYIVDRLKDMIISGGENVHSIEVENIISTHPAVSACAVIGVPSTLWVESVHAVVVLRPGANLSFDQLKEHCRAELAGFKCPKTMEIRQRLPLSTVGKVLKSKLREEYKK